MSSINRNQPEHNRVVLWSLAAIEKIREIVRQAPTCFFSTAQPTGDTQGVRPMNVRQVDDDGNLWFLSPIDSHQNQEIGIDPIERLYYQGSSHYDFMMLTGRATISRMKAKIHELWEPIIKTWFTVGEDDPRITVIQVSPQDGYYWDTKHGQM